VYVFVRQQSFSEKLHLQEKIKTWVAKYLSQFQQQVLYRKDTVCLNALHVHTDMYMYILRILYLTTEGKEFYLDLEFCRDIQKVYEFQVTHAWIGMCVYSFLEKNKEHIKEEIARK